VPRFVIYVATNTRQNIKQGIEGHPVSWYSEVFDLIFPNIDREKASKCQACEWKKTHDTPTEKEEEDKD
jgi:ATP-dependent Lon protease